MDLTVIDRIPATVGQAGATTAPAHTLYDIVRKLPEGAQVEIEAGGEDSRLKLKAGRSTFTLSTLPREDFPLTSGDDLPQAFPLKASELRTLIDRTRFAISTEETRYYLNGLFLHATQSNSLPEIVRESGRTRGRQYVS